MKEFEKWWSNSPRKFDMESLFYIHNLEDKEILECSWEAALEWVLKEMEAHEVGQSKTPYRTSWKCVYMMIMDELRE